jgi:hypothetical protein
MSLRTPRLNLPLIAAGQAQKELSHNEALALIDGIVSGAVETLGANDPPGTPTVGQSWIVGSAPTGVWAGNAQALALWTEGGWRFLAATSGLKVWVKDQQLWALYDGASWDVGTVRASTVSVLGEQVLGGRGAAVGAPTGGSVVDTEARTAIAAVIDRLVAHGLIAP